MTRRAARTLDAGQGFTLVGVTEPRIFTPPLRELTEETSLGFAAIRFAENVLKVHLLPWQRWLLIHMLELREDGSFRFRNVVVLVARQNGKTHLSKVLSLFFLFVLRVGLVLGIAQDLDIAEDTWRDACDLAKLPLGKLPDLQRLTDFLSQIFVRVKLIIEKILKIITNGPHHLTTIVINGK